MPLSKADLTVSSLAEFLTHRAEVTGDQPALITPSGRLTYRELEQKTEQCCRGLRSAGVRPGMRCVLMVKPGIEFMVLVFALARLNAILVVVDPGIGRRHLARCLAKARPNVFIGIPSAHFARLVLGWARETLTRNITVGRRWCWRGPTFDQVLAAGLNAETFHPETGHASLDVTAAIIFTSGSTGPPKGVVYTHRMFLAQARLLQEQFSIQPGEVDLATFPLFALYDVVWGATTVFPIMDFTRPARVSSAEIIGRIQRHEVTHLFGSPALLNRVGRYAARQGIRLPTLRRVLSAGAPVEADVLRRFAGLLHGEAQVFTPYGATEALPVTCIGHRDRFKEDTLHSGKGVCVGGPFPGVELAVIPITEEAIPEWSQDLCLPSGAVGELVVWGPNVSPSYDAEPEANRLSKIRSGDGLVRHRMGDLACIDERNRVWYCGRKSQRVIAASDTYFTVSCEVVFNQHPAVFRTALVGVGRPPGQRPVLCVELENKRRWRGSEELRAELLQLAQRYPHTRDIRTVLFHKSFPVDIRHNSKIFREQLAEWASHRLREGAR